MINAAIIGMGWWGKQVVESLSGKTDKIQLIRAVDVNPDPIADFCKKRAIILTNDIQDAIDDATVDAVILCTPHLAHEEQIARVAAAKKHVFCEKPLGLTRESAENSVASCKRAGVVLGIGHERRYEPPMEEIKQLIERGQLGTVMHVESNFSHDKFVDIPLDNWRADLREAPAAGMTGMGIHLTDSYIDMVGRISETYAITTKRIVEMPAGDIIAVQFKFSDGPTGFLCAISATPFYSRFTVFGSDGWAEASDSAHPEKLGTSHLTVCGKDGHRIETEFKPFDSVKANFEAFADAIEGHNMYRFSEEQLVHNIATLEAICKSAELGQPVKVE